MRLTSPINWKKDDEKILNDWFAVREKIWTGDQNDEQRTGNVKRSPQQKEWKNPSLRNITNSGTKYSPTINDAAIIIAKLKNQKFLQFRT